MKTNAFLILSFSTVIFFTIGCEKDEDSKKHYINLEYSEFFDLSDKEIVDSVASILNVKPFEFTGTTDKWEESVGIAGISWIQDGKKYMNSDDHSIILWTDSINNLSSISYLNYRQSKSDNWGNIENQINNHLNELFTKSGLIQKNNEMVSLKKCAAGMNNIRWFEANCTQTFKADTLEYPYFTAEIEGDTCKINFMIIPIWYDNLNDINQWISDDELKNKAKEYYQMDNEVISIPDHLEIYGYWIIHNKMGKKVGSAIIDEYGSYIYLFIDIQNGEIIEKEKHYIR